MSSRNEASYFIPCQSCVQIRLWDQIQLGQIKIKRVALLYVNTILFNIAIFR